MAQPGPGWSVADFRSELHAWLDAHHDELAPRVFPARDPRRAHGADATREVDVLFDAGWMRYGWPERVGGLGGSPMLRTELGAALAARDLTDPGLFSLIEVLAPTLIDFASPALAAEVVPRLLSGAEMWCQGFSEPSTGSDLASLGCRAVPDGDAATAADLGDQRPEGLDQPGPVRGSLRAAHAYRAGGVAPPRNHGVLPRHGHAGDHRRSARDDQRHAGVRRGVLRRRCRSGRADPRRGERRLGGRDEHPALRALLVLLATHRVPVPATGTGSRRRVGRRAQRGDRRQRLLAPPRAPRPITRDPTPARRTEPRSGAETSIDKVLVATAEHATYDAVRRLLPGTSSRSTTAAVGATWRAEYLYSRAATIYGGTAEVQRNIIARRLLDLGGDVMDAAERTLLADTIDARADGARDTDAALDRDRVARVAGGRAARRDRPRVRRARRRRQNGNRARRRRGIGARAAAARGPRRAAPAVRRVGRPRRHRRRAGRRGRAHHGSRRHRRRPARRVHRRIGPSRAHRADGVRRDPRRAGRRSRRRAPRRTRCNTVAGVDAALDATAWEAAVAFGRRAVAHQIAGASRTMLALARDHALDRIQFGRPIASFQAVRHRLADALVAVEALDATLGAAGDEPNPAHCGARQGDGRADRADRRRPLPAGARGHRLHDRPPVSPIPQADDAARRRLRISRRDRDRHRSAAPRGASRADAHRALTRSPFLRLARPAFRPVGASGGRAMGQVRPRKRSTFARRSGVSNDSVSAAIAKSMVASTARSTCRFRTRFVASTA